MTEPRIPTRCINCGRDTYKDQMIKRPGKAAQCKACHALAKARRIAIRGKA